MAKVKEEHYTLTKILEQNADYNVIFGERSNGKTTAVLSYALNDYVSSGYKNQLALIRRWDEDFKGKNGQQMYDGIVNLGWVKDFTKGRFNNVYYYSRGWYLCLYDDDGKRIRIDEQPFAIAFALSQEEHYKSTSYPNVKTVLFDEFITRDYYLPEEFVIFQHLLSTIIRLRNDVKIFMCGNTINKYNPYFEEMGLTNAKTMKKGTIDVYSYGESLLKVAVEYSDFPAKMKKSNKYFAFNNPKLQMITNGAWEIAIYPHLPYKYDKSEIVYWYYIVFDKEILQCEIIYKKKEQVVFTYIHRKTTPIKEDTKQIVYSKEYNPKPNYSRLITKPTNDIEKKILKFYREDKVFYQDNEVGELVRNYIIWCVKEQ